MAYVPEVCDVNDTQTGNGGVYENKKKINVNM